MEEKEKEVEKGPHISLFYNCREKLSQNFRKDKKSIFMEYKNFKDKKDVQMSVKLFDVKIGGGGRGS